ncbi:MAG TPA: YCF48-related protein [Ignavibacteria bacterium]|nr:YCF48-related protein [Ignavibacteria bacterium]
MKKLITILFLHCLFSIAEAQWILQNSFTNDNLYDVEFYNRYTGWAVGDGGTILKTTNGGTNWNNIPNPAVGKPLSSIHIVDSNICYVVGWFETIVKSTNGGNDWVIIRNGPWGSGSSYDAVFFTDESTGWIAGTGQKVLRTTNGGDTIITAPLFAGNLHDMYFKDALTGIVTGSGTDMFKTTNGGINWYNITMPIGFRIPDFYKLTFVKNQFGWVAGSDNRIFSTTDFGDTWDSLSRISVNPLTASMRFAKFIDENTGFVGGERAYLYKSTNGGKDWLRENSGDFSQRIMLSMFFYNDSLGWIVGGDGKIIHTTNGGQTMVNVSNINNMISSGFTLYQNYPNPFNPSTSIKIVLQKESFIQIKIFDIQGKEILSLVNEILYSGNYILNFDGSEMNSGIYFYSLFADGVHINTKHMIYLK